ncbi:MAG: LLM class flavin-dependent oxidoreductase [Chloroflexota bacterium]|nr:LLM class flavin-dependent oxidoreductase [Chloroflexota bacterium]
MTQFGYCVPIFAYPGSALFRTPNYAELDAVTTMRVGMQADELGFDSIWVADHLMLGKDEAILEGWTTLAALAGATKRAKLGIIHQGHFFRHPAVHAKMIATLDQIAGGRFIYFADTGTRMSEHAAYGLNFPVDVEVRMADFIEGLELQLALWRATPDAPLTFNGDYYYVKNAICTPPPFQHRRDGTPAPPIWFGEAHPLTFAACAKYGDGWNSVPVSSDELRRRLAALDAACRDIGRDPAEIERTYETQILIAPDRAALRAALNAMIALDAPASGSLNVPAQMSDEIGAFLRGETDDYPRVWADQWLIGTPDEVAARIQQYVEMGISHFLLWFMDAPRADGMRLFAEQVAPRFR